MNGPTNSLSANKEKPPSGYAAVCVASIEAFGPAETPLAIVE